MDVIIPSLLYNFYLPGQAGQLDGNRNSYFWYFILSSGWAGENMAENKTKRNSVGIIALTVRFNCSERMDGIADLPNLHWLNTNSDCS